MTSDLRSITPTLCNLLGAELPRLVSAPALEGLSGPVERVLIYCPDAVGSALVRDFSGCFAPVREATQKAIELRSMVPPKTPVCFASMFTGALPSAHGIQGPVRPVLSCDTLFDALTRAGKKVALSAVKGCSIDLIFRNRPLDYFSEKDDQDAIARAQSLLRQNHHDLIVVYNQEYDDCLHRSACRSEAALSALRHHIDAFACLAQSAAEAWKKQPYAIMFCPDHGGHDVDGRGFHGDDIPEDMEVTHFFGIFGG